MQQVLKFKEINNLNHLERVARLRGTGLFEPNYKYMQHMPT